MGHDPTLQQTHIARQQNPFFATCHVCQINIVRIDAICGIGTEETQTPGQPPQVNVEDESDRAERRRPYVGQRADIDRHESWEHRNAIGVLHRVVEGYRGFVRQDPWAPQSLTCVITRTTCEPAGGEILVVRSHPTQEVRPPLREYARLAHTFVPFEARKP